MLSNEDLPDGWEVFESPSSRGAELEHVLQIGDAEAIYSWDEIRHTESGLRILLRMAPPEVAEGRIVNDGALVTGVVVMPRQAGERITAANMRFPLGAIEGAANLRRSTLLHEVHATIAAGEYSPPDPLGRPDGSDEFYARVAVLWRFFEEDENPTARLREINDVPLSTAQRWVTESRRRNFLPPGRRGRAK